MKCILCERRKSKRFCPAKDAQICPQCCGEKRVLEIHCPESCSYLKVGRNHEATEYARHIHSLDARHAERNERVLGQFQGVVSHLEYVIGRERLQSRDMTDQAVAEAAGLLLDTYRTEDKGILYERTSDDLVVEPLRRQLREVIQSYRGSRPEDGGGIVDPRQQRLPLRAAIECLEFIRDVVASHRENRAAPTSYVDLLARLFPRDEKAGGSIIIP